MRMLPAGARIGTLDKFQGQEAPVCLISMATSSADELPRNIEFLSSVNRLNVAISRAQALAVVFASPRLTTAYGGGCRYFQLALDTHPSRTCRQRSLAPSAGSRLETRSAPLGGARAALEAD